MFSKIGFVTTALIASLCAAIYQFQIKVEPSDFLEQNQTATEVKSPAQKTTQHRTGVKKEIWTVKNGQRALFRLTSKESHLTVIPRGNKFEIREQLNDLTCCMQEEVTLVKDQKVQEIRTLSAPQGTYLFPAHQFTADAVDMKFFRIQGETLPDYQHLSNPYISGQAFGVAFGASHKTLQFKASYMKANLDPKQVFHQDL